MKYKARILELIKNAPEDVKKLTVEELIEKFTKEIDKEQKIEKDKYAEVISKYKGAYIKFKDNYSFFGCEVNFIYIKDIETGSLTTEWERLFDISGHKVIFSDFHSTSKKIESNIVGNSMTSKNLDASKIITEEEFDEALLAHSNMQEIIKKMQK